MHGIQQRASCIFAIVDIQVGHGDIQVLVHQQPVFDIAFRPQDIHLLAQREIVEQLASGVDVIRADQQLLQPEERCQAANLLFGRVPLLVHAVPGDRGAVIRPYIESQDARHDQRQEEGCRRHPRCPIDGRVLAHPGQVESLGVDFIGDRQLTLSHRHQSRKLELGLQRRLFIIWNSPPAQHLAVQLEQGILFGVVEQVIAHELQVGLAARLLGQEERPHQLVHLRIAAFRQGLLYQRLAQLLGQVRVAIRPVEDAVQDGCAAAGIGRLQALRQHDGILATEGAQRDLVADVEGRARAVFDQVGRRSHAQQHKGQALEVRVAGARIVHGADGGEEIVAKIQLEGAVNLVNEDNDALLHLNQGHLAQKIGKTLRRAQRGALFPPFHRVHRQAQALLELGQQAQVPLIHRYGANLGQVNDHHPRPLGIQLAGGADHQAGFAHLPRREDVTEITFQGVLQQLAVGRALYVRGRVGAQGAASGIEIESVGGQVAHRSLSLK